MLYFQGFLCEPYVIPDAQDISQYGGWRNYLASWGKTS
ncbi:allophanate hydrolase-related protein [Nostoc sp.]